MKRFALSLLAASSLVLAGCATVPPGQTGIGAVNAQVASFSVTAGRVCTVVQPTLASVTMEASLLDPPLDAPSQAKLKKITDDTNLFCNLTASATSQTAVGLINETFPILMGIIAKSNLPAAQRNAYLLSLAGVNTAAMLLITSYAQPTVPTAPTTATPAPAQAPAATTATPAK